MKFFSHLAKLPPIDPGIYHPKTTNPQNDKPRRSISNYKYGTGIHFFEY